MQKLSSKMQEGAGAQDWFSALSGMFSFMGRNLDVLCGNDLSYSLSVSNPCMLCGTLCSENNDWYDN